MPRLAVTAEHDHLPLDIYPPPPGGRHWARTLQPAYVTINGTLYMLQARFAYDGSSIPPVAWWTLATPLEWPWCYMGAVHDGMYAGALRRVGATLYHPPAWFPPLVAHCVFYELGRACGVSPGKAGRAFLGVTLWGLVRGHRTSYVSREHFLDTCPHGEIFERTS